VPPPLFAAASSKWDELVLLLLKTGADPRASFFHQSERTDNVSHLMKRPSTWLSRLRASVYRLIISENNKWPTLVEILHAMLAEENPRILEGACRLLWLSRKAQGSAILPKPEELRVLLRHDPDTSSREYSGSVEEIWKEFCKARDNPHLHQQRKCPWLITTACGASKSHRAWLPPERPLVDILDMFTDRYHVIQAQHTISSVANNS
jgi:hypothetical protein